MHPRQIRHQPRPTQCPPLQLPPQRKTHPLIPLTPRQSQHRHNQHQIVIRLRLSLLQPPPQIRHAQTKRAQAAIKAPLARADGAQLAHPRRDVLARRFGQRLEHERMQRCRLVLLRRGRRGRLVAAGGEGVAHVGGERADDEEADGGGGGGVVLLGGRRVVRVEVRGEAVQAQRAVEHVVPLVEVLEAEEAGEGRELGRDGARAGCWGGDL